MASSGSSDDNFRARVEKVFGSLSFSHPSSSFPAASPSPASSKPLVWSLTDEEVEKREWKRDKSASYDRDEMPCASSFDELLKQQRISRNVRKQLSTLGQEDEAGQVRGDEDELDDEWSIRSSIGLDPTLDDEAEEDEYDKVALGRENAGERLYMKDVTDPNGSSLESLGTIHEPSDKIIRDPRANHLAARIRLKEDEAEAKKSSTTPNHDSERTSSKEAVPPKPILKRKENSSETRSSKRVKFDLGSEAAKELPDDDEGDGMTSANVPSMEPSDSESSSRLGKSRNRTMIPDYLQNPSRYTRYSFDSSSDINANKSEPKLDEGSLEASSSSSTDGLKLTFIPQKKAKGIAENKNSCEKMANNEEKQESTATTTGIAAGEVSSDDEPKETENKESDIDVTQTEISIISFQKPSRHYRSKKASDKTDA